MKVCVLLDRSSWGQEAGLRHKMALYVLYVKHNTKKYLRDVAFDGMRVTI